MSGKGSAIVSSDETSGAVIPGNYISISAVRPTPHYGACRKPVDLTMRPKEKRVRQSTRAGIIFPVSRIRRQFKQSIHSARFRLNPSAPVYLAAVIEYLVAEIFDVTNTFTVKDKAKRISPRHINLAIQDDAELAKLLENVTIREGGVVPFIHDVLLKKKKRTIKKKAAKKPAIKVIEVDSDTTTTDSD